MTISPVLCAIECRQNIVRQFAYNELNQLARSAPVAKTGTKVYNHYNRIAPERTSWRRMKSIMCGFMKCDVLM